jgi:DNA-binding PadR family transcriptional regulator
LYGAITRLQQRSWIRLVASFDRRQSYAITAEGRKYLQAELGDLDDIVRTGLARLKNA